MKQHAFSLLELMVSLSIALIILTGLLAFSQVALTQSRTVYERTRSQASLDISHEELMLATRGLEHGFWDKFPRNLSMVHGPQHQHGALDYSADCPVALGNGCITRWDLRPSGKDATIFEVLSDDYPQIVRVAPVNGYESSTFKEIQPMSVFLVCSDTGAFPILLQDISVDQLELAPPAVQPWLLPETLPENAQLVHLGQLEVTHICLYASQGDHQLEYQPWTLSSGAWKAKQRVRTQGNLRRLLWQACSADTPDRLILVAPVSRAKTFYPPLIIGDTTFHEEVSCASLEF